MNTWAFNQLNQITPETSPHNGPGSEQDRNDSSLSFPVSGAALQQQLEAWTNVAFDFDSSDFGSSLDGSFEAKAGGGGETDRMTGREYYGRVSAGLDNYSLGIGHDDSFQSLLGVDPLLAAAPVDHFANLFATSTVNNSLLLGPPAAAADLPVAPTTSPADSYKAPKGAAKKRRASSSVGSSVPPETPAESAGPIDADDELNAVAVEEDKRRRNTAASARFRIKKKQREAALESTAKELRDKVANLEREVDSLRTENGWLRGLIVGKEEAEQKRVKAEEASEGFQAAKRARLDEANEIAV